MKHFAWVFFVLSVLTAPNLALAQAEDKPGKDKVEAESRDAKLMEVLQQLQEEVKQLRREVNQLKAERAAGRGEAGGERRTEGRREEGESVRKREKEGEGVERERPRDGEGPERRETKARGERSAKKRQALPEAVNLHSSGVIREVNQEGRAQKLTLSVKEDGKEMDLVCVLGEGTEITLNGKEAAFEDLKTGDHAECEYVLKGEKMAAVARSIAAKRGTVLEQGK